MALADAARPPRRRALVIRASRRLPVPALLGLRLASRRPRRLVLSTLSVAITVALMVTMLAVHLRNHHSKVPGGLVNPIHAGVDQVFYVITVVLVLLAAINTVFVAAATALDNRRQLAVARSLGATQEQVAAGLSVAQLVPALPGVVLGIPFGIGLIAATGHGSTVSVPSAWAMIAVGLATMLGVIALTAIPARIGARRPPGEILQAELA
jgi:putative ABC transport system permease protein